ncbi:MAG: flagellar basal-body rod protein FlgF [Bdellovibrio sp.]|nr:MAG: flagellar basal-body rod protein FlgF [Bdellovibrio sp.]
MSTKGIFTALSGAMAQDQKLETIANNLANVNTTAFKKDQLVFREYLTANEKEPQILKVPKVPASIESFYDMNGGDKSYVDVAGSYTDFSQGHLKPTGNALDVAIEGSGFFEVLTPQGIQYTRNGSFKVDGQGFLVNQNGYPVLRAGTEAPQARRLQVQNGNRLTISYSGDVYERGENLGRLSVVDFNNKDALKKVGRGLYSLKPNYNEAPRPQNDVKIHQGFLEGSNVNIVKEMTDMISTTRTFQSTQEAIKAFDSMNEKLVNVVPKTN